jgi:hypothetical protein
VRVRACACVRALLSAHQASWVALAAARVGVGTEGAGVKGQGYPSLAGALTAAGHAHTLALSLKSRPSWQV